MHFSSSESKTTHPFQVGHSNIWGPLHTLSIYDYQYYIHFVDDFTQYTWIYPIKAKFEAHTIFVRFNTFIERQFNQQIKCFQIDWGCEYKSLLPILFCLGIQFTHPCLHTHQQNSKAERKHMHVVEMSLYLLANGSLPFKFWWDAFVSSTFTINRLPTPLIGHISQFQKLFGHVLDYSFLKVFGCAYFPYLCLYNNHKFQYKSTKCLFFCYSPYHKGYRCFSPSGRLYIVHMVNFNEQEFPYSELFSPQSSSFTCPVQQLVLHVFPLDDPSLDSTHV